MSKKYLLYVSPFWPVKSGISEYSETLIWGLEKYFNVVLLTDNYKIQNKKIREHFEIIQYSEKNDYSGYDYIFYNFGNNPDAHEFMYDMVEKYPGYVILHDLSLYYLSTAHYMKKDMLYQKIYEMEGAEGLSLVKERIKECSKTDLLQFKELSSRLWLNKEILKCAKGIFVHSKYAADKIKELGLNINTKKIHLVNCMPQIDLEGKDAFRKKYGLKLSDYVVASFGFIAPSKCNKLCCAAINQYNVSHKDKIHYFMVGAGDYADDMLGEYIHKTGFTNNNEFFSAMNACDLVLNLRTDYNGESSATLLQCMYMEKLCIVSKVGWFDELSDEIVLKIDENATEKELEKLVADCKRGKYDFMKTRAVNFSKNMCSKEGIVNDIYEYLNKLLSQ